MRKTILLIAIMAALAFPGNILADEKADRIAALESQIAELQAELDELKASPDETPQVSDDESEDLQLSLDYMLCSLDDFSGDAKYYSPSGYRMLTYKGEDQGYITKDIDSPISIYIFYKKADDVYKLVVSFSYKGDDWIFFDEVQIKTGDNIDTIDLSKMSPSRTVGSGIVYERYSVYPGENLINTLSNVAQAGEASIRLRGSDGHFDYTLDESIIQAIDETLKVYNQLSK